MGSPSFMTVTTLAFVTLGIGVLFYHFTEGLSWIDAIYFCVVTLATVGYGDIVPRTTAGKLFTAVYILSGIGIIGSYARLIFERRGQRLENGDRALRHDKPKFLPNPHTTFGKSRSSMRRI